MFFLIKKEIATNMDFIILDNMTRNNPGTMILVLGDDNEGKVKLREHRIEEFINTPDSPENLADKIPM
jgi:multisubunit Na+/H+ antiporter MnhE subunit